MDSYIWIRLHHPCRAAYNSRLGVLCDLAVIYNKPFENKNMQLLQKDNTTNEEMNSIRK